MRITAEVICELLDKHSRPVKVLRFKSKSFVKNFMNMLYAILCKTTSPAKDLDGNDTQWVGYRENLEDRYTHHHFGMYFSEGNDRDSIIVGSGTAAVTPDDYNLASKIPHGEGNGQLYYHEAEITEPNTTDSEAEVKIRRKFVNLGSVTVTVREVGLVNNPTHYHHYTQEMPGPRLLARDILPSEVAIDPLYGLLVTYRIYVSV